MIYIEEKLCTQIDMYDVRIDKPQRHAGRCYDICEFYQFQMSVLDRYIYGQTHLLYETLLILATLHINKLSYCYIHRVMIKKHKFIIATAYKTMEYIGFKFFFITNNYSFRSG